MDKDEIMAEAQRIGTYPISIIPDQDCCTLFTPKHPATRARLAAVEAGRAALPIEEMVERRAWRRPSWRTSAFPVLESTRPIAHASTAPADEPSMTDVSVRERDVDA